MRKLLALLALLPALALGQTNDYNVLDRMGQGVTDGSDAAPGTIGEFISAILPVGSAVALTDNVAANIVSITLTAGDWDVRGVGAFTPAGTTSITHLSSGISMTSGALGGFETQGTYDSAAFVPARNMAIVIALTRVSLTTTTTVYLVSHARFTVSTLGGYGFIRARRVR